MPRRALLLTIALLPVALATLACGLAGTGATLSCRSSCSEDGRCGARTWSAGDGLVRCYPRTEADCRESGACAERGLCDYRPGRAQEACIAARDVSCEDSTGCRDEGLCRADHTGRCHTSAVGCLESRACLDEGRCRSWNDRCRTGLHEDRCRDACRLAGACAPEGTRCRAVSEEACRRSHFCSYAGRCSLVGDRCEAASDADCAGSSMCEWNGYCSMQDGHCVELTEPCVDACQLAGRCGLEEAFCVAQSDAACEASLACLVQGRCAHDGRRCVPGGDEDCARSLEGRAYGRTQDGGTFCAEPSRPRYHEAYSDSRCVADPACATEGRCLYGPRATCQTPEEFGLPEIPPERRPRRRGPFSNGSARGPRDLR